MARRVKEEGGRRKDGEIEKNEKKQREYRGVEKEEKKDEKERETG